MSRRAKLWCVIAVLFCGVNGSAFQHARRLTHFVPAGERTLSPEKLSFAGKVRVLITGVTVPKPESGPITNEHRAVRVTTADGLQLAAWDIPGLPSSGLVVLMFHGYATSKSALRPEAGLLREAGCRTVLVDLRGHGESAGWVTTFGWHEAQDVVAVWEWARREWPSERLVLYGQSAGSVAILRALATSDIRPAGLILETPFDRFVTTVGHRYRTMGLPAFPASQLLVFWGGVQLGFNAFAHNSVAYAGRVECPALVLGGARDLWVKPAEVRRVAAAIAGPAVTHIFETAGHGGFARDCAAEYRQVVGAWLQLKNR
jgi:pimeloyl-ACP methyl ester carboxylesterase